MQIKLVPLKVYWRCSIGDLYSALRLRRSISFLKNRAKIIQAFPLPLCDIHGINREKLWLASKEQEVSIWKDVLEGRELRGQTEEVCAERHGRCRSAEDREEARRRARERDRTSLTHLCLSFQGNCLLSARQRVLTFASNASVFALWLSKGWN